MKLTPGEQHPLFSSGGVCGIVSPDEKKVCFLAPAHTGAHGWDTGDLDGLPRLVLTQHAIFGLGFEVRLMRDTPNLDVAAALKHIEDECGRIGRGDVSQLDIIG